MTIDILKSTTSSLHSFLMQHPGAMYVGRGYGSKLGNPFAVKENTPNEVARVVALFRIYLDLVTRKEYTPKQAASYCEFEHGGIISDVWKRNIPSREDVIKVLNLYLQLHELECLTLVCYCVNKKWEKQEQYVDCHAEVIAAAVDAYLTLERRFE